MQGEGGAMAADRDPITVSCSKLLKAQFLKGKKEVNRMTNSINAKMD